MSNAPAGAAFPIGKFLAVIAATTAALIMLWTVVKVGGIVDGDVYKGVLLGLVCAAASHTFGTFVGAIFAARMVAGPGGGNPIISAYLASTTVRFIATPTLAVSLYFLLPQKPAPLLLGAAAGHILIMVADIATLMRYLQGSEGSIARNA
jgi:hypothetical protein